VRSRALAAPPDQPDRSIARESLHGDVKVVGSAGP